MGNLVCCSCCCCFKNKYQKIDNNVVYVNQTISEELTNPINNDVNEEIQIYENEIKHQPWYYGSISRKMAEEIFSVTSSEDRSFLIRKSKYPFAPFILSMKKTVEDKISITHVKINFEESHFFVTEKEKFPSVLVLVEAYFGHGKTEEEYLSPIDFDTNYHCKFRQDFKKVVSSEAEQDILTKHENIIQNEPWYFGSVSRKLTECFYLKEDVKAGTFLIRKSTCKEYPFILSYKSFINSIESHVKHYKIVFIHEKSQFSTLGLTAPSLAALVDMLKENEKMLTPCTKKVMERLYDLSPKFCLDWEIPVEDLDIENKVLGSGNFGMVHRAVWQKEKYVAVKIIKTTKDLNKELFLKEIKIMKQLRHKYVIRLFGMCTKTEPYMLINEFATNGNLKSYIKQNCNVSLYECVNFAAEIAEGMEYLANMNIVHRDLACRNILLDEQFIVKISDFGLSRQLIDGEYITATIGVLPLRWYPIESIGDNIFTTKSDVWSFGILIHEMFNNCKLPYEGMKIANILQFLLQGRRIEKPEIMPFVVYKVCLTCWSTHEEKRPTFEMLKNFFNVYKSDPHVDTAVNN